MTKWKTISENYIKFDAADMESVGIWGGILPGKGKGIGMIFTKYGVEKFSISTQLQILERLPVGREVKITYLGEDASTPGPNPMKLFRIDVNEDEGGLEIASEPEREQGDTQKDDAPF